MKPLTLVAAKPEYADEYYTWRQEKLLRQFNPQLPLDLSKLRARLAQVSSDLRGPRADEYRWFAHDGEKLVGTVSVKQLNWFSLTAEIGYHIKESEHGKGYGYEAARLLLVKIFSESPLERLIATIATDNVASQKVAEKLGFQREGLLRKHVILSGRRSDQYVYGLLKDEFTAF